MTNDKPASDGGAETPAQKIAGEILAASGYKPVRMTVEERYNAERGIKKVPPLHPTVEEQFDRDASLMQALHDPENQPSQYGTVPMSYLDNQKPSLLRRAWNRVKRVFRYRSAETGLFVSKKYAEANPDTTVREHVD